ncbi:MAG: hypothetical protein HY717_11740 [Planctomycetes bacterium]|nr:hypothetical protein [Planctomycetota bacterium]
MVTASLVAFITSQTFAQVKVEWETRFGGPLDDWAQSIQPTTDGGFIAVGATYLRDHPLAGEVYLVKLDSRGVPTWEKTFGGAVFDEGQAVSQTSDGGYIITGATGGEAPCGLDCGTLGLTIFPDLYLVKTNPDGKLLWTKSFGGPKSEIGRSVRQTTEGGYIVAGQTRSKGAGLYDVYVIKATAEGDLEWERSFGGTQHDIGYSIIKSRDGGHIITGKSSSFNPNRRDEVYLLKIDAFGERVWETTFGQENTHWEGSSVIELADGSLIVVGASAYSGQSDILLLKTDFNGNLIWFRIIGDTAKEGVINEWAVVVRETQDGGFLLAGGYGFGFTHTHDVYLVKTDRDGNTLWDKTFGDSTEDEFVRSMERVDHDSYVLAGDSSGVVDPSFVNGYDAFAIKVVLEPLVDRPFIRGDSNCDGEVNLNDAMVILYYLFLGSSSISCEDAADVDDQGSIDITDPIYIFLHFFRGGPSPPHPYPKLGADLTKDELGFISC